MKPSGFARSASLVTAFTLAGLCLGFLSNLVLAAKFGIGGEMDAYLAASTLPSLLTLILTLSISATFLPVFAEYRRQNPAEGWKVLNALMNLVALGAFAISLACIVAAAPLTRWLAPGLPPDESARAAELTRWLMPSVAIAAINQLLSSVFYARGKFFAPMLPKILAPSLVIAAVWFLSPSTGAKSLAIATLCAGLLQTGILAAGLRGERFRFTLGIDARHPAVRRILRLMLPMMLGMCLYKLAPALERWIASGMPPGSISTLGYATRLINVLQPVIVSGISVSGFALMAERISERDLEGLRDSLAKSCSALFFVSVPLAAFLCAFGEDIIRLAFERGAFTGANTAATWPLFSLYALALPATTVGTVVGQAFYAFQDTRIPTWIGLAEISLFAALGLLLAPHFGLRALPLGFLVSFYATSIWITFLLSRKTGFSVPALFARPLLQSLAATGPALAVALGAVVLLPRSRFTGLACLAAGLGIYFALQLFAFRSPEAQRLLRMAGRRAGTRGHGA